MGPVDFATLTEPYRRELHLHCYRMLGSVTDADEVLQETMIAAWRGLDAFEGRSSPRTWLYRIATRRCLNAIRDAKRRPLPSPVPPFEPPEPSRLDEPTWLEPYPDRLVPAVEGPAERLVARETVELAFVVVLQRMPPRQAAAVVLTDVLGFGPVEVADMLGVTPTATKGLLQRGRAALGPREAVAGSGSEVERDLARRFAERFTVDDIDGVVALLTDDVWLAMPPAPHRYDGPSAVAGFLRASASWRPDRRVELCPTRANTQPAFLCTLGGASAGLLVLTPRGDRIGALTRFLRTFRTTPDGDWTAGPPLGAG